MCILRILTVKHAGSCIHEAQQGVIMQRERFEPTNRSNKDHYLNDKTDSTFRPKGLRQEFIRGGVGVNTVFYTNEKIWFEKNSVNTISSLEECPFADRHHSGDENGANKMRFEPGWVSIAATFGNSMPAMPKIWKQHAKIVIAQFTCMSIQYYSNCANFTWPYFYPSYDISSWVILILACCW